MPRISVIIPTYNREKYVVNAVESVLNQTFTDHEVIVIDDGSTDETQSVLKPLKDRIRYIRQSNSGVSAARNAGIRCAVGQWVAFLDSDDEWMREYLSRQMAGVARTPRICMQAADCLFIGLNGERTRYFELNQALPAFNGNDYLMIEAPFQFVIRHGPWQVGSTIFLADAIRRAGLFDTSLKISEDFDLMARVALEGPFGMIGEVLVNIHRRDEPVECLTGQAERHPLQARESSERIYTKLNAIHGLSRHERKAVNEMMSANRRAIGNLLFKIGERKEARESYRRAFLDYPCARSLGKYLLSLARTVSKRSAHASKL